MTKINYSTILFYLGGEGFTELLYKNNSPVGGVGTIQPVVLTNKLIW